MADAQDRAGPYVFEHGDVWFRAWDRDGRPTEHRHVCSGSEDMAAAYDAEDGVLHKHGSAGAVEAWAQATRKRFADRGFDAMADAITVVRFMAAEPAVAELNACIATTGRIARFAERLAAMADEVGPPPPWAGLR